MFIWTYSIKHVVLCEILKFHFHFYKHKKKHIPNGNFTIPFRGLVIFDICRKIFILSDKLSLRLEKLHIKLFYSVIEGFDIVQMNNFWFAMTNNLHLPRTKDQTQFNRKIKLRSYINDGWSSKNNKKKTESNQRYVSIKAGTFPENRNLYNLIFASDVWFVVKSKTTGKKPTNK